VTEVRGSGPIAKIMETTNSKIYLVGRPLERGHILYSKLKLNVHLWMIASAFVRMGDRWNWLRITSIE
jgi:hypothetical protein